MINALGREIPDEIPGNHSVRPFLGLNASGAAGGGRKLLRSIDAVLEACELRDGATISFHHHLRNGDGVLNAVLDAVARRGLRGIRIAASSLFPVHAPLVEHIRTGVVTGISATY